MNIITVWALTLSMYPTGNLDTKEMSNTSTLQVIEANLPHYPTQEACENEGYKLESWAADQGVSVIANCVETDEISR